MENKELIEDIKNVCIEYFGIIIKDDKANEILKEHPSIKEFGAYDTEERSNIINYICLDICNMKWPKYKDTDEYQLLFKKSIVENASSKGYELEEEAWIKK